jgi:recombination protein RecA
MVDIDKLPEINALAKKKYKKTFQAGSERPHITRIPFHSPELNIATGGGIPLGRMARIWGHESSGKSLTSLLLAKNAQNIHLIAQELLESEHDLVKEVGETILKRFPDGMTVCLYDVEGSFDPQFATDVGVDIEKLNVFDDRRIEVVGEIAEAALGAAHLHIIDSTAGAVSVEELAAKISDWQRALKARVWNKVLDRFKEGLTADNAIVLIDQVRVDQKTGALIAPGGKKMAHESSLTIKLRKGSDLFRKDGKLVDQMPQKDNTTITGKAEIVGMEIQATVPKNKAGQANRNAHMRYIKDERRFDNLHELAKAAKWLGVANEYSAGYFELPSGEKIHGQDALKAAISEDVEFKQAIIDEINLYIVEHP